MKRSNQLLLALLLVIIIVPISLAFTFRQMQKKKHYTIVSNASNHKSGAIKPYKVVHIIGYDSNDNSGAQSLTCRLHSSAEGSYQWTSFSERDSISVYNQGDTLYVRYVSKHREDEAVRYYVHYGIDLSLPDMEHIVVTGATLEMDSIDAAINPDINLHLNRAVLKAGNKIDEIVDNSVMPSDENGQTLPAYHKLSINADSSQLYFGKGLQMDSLLLRVRNQSSINMAEAFPVKSISGAVYDDAVIRADMDMIRRLSGL